MKWTNECVCEKWQSLRWSGAWTVWMGSPWQHFVTSDWQFDNTKKLNSVGLKNKKLNVRTYFVRKIRFRFDVVKLDFVSFRRMILKKSFDVQNWHSTYKINYVDFSVLHVWHFCFQPEHRSCKIYRCPQGSFENPLRKYGLPWSGGVRVVLH